MISLNVGSDLDAALRSLSQQSNRSLSAVCCGLIRLGLERSPVDVLAAVNAAARPIGRTMILPIVPSAPAADKPQPGETPVNFMRRKRAARLAAEKAEHKAKKGQ